MLAGSEALLHALLAGVKDEDEAREALEDAGLLVNGTVASRGNVIITRINNKELLARLGPVIRVEAGDGTYVLAYKDVDCGLKAVDTVTGEVHGTRLALASQLCLANCGDREARLGDYVVRARAEAGDLAHVCLFNPTTGEWREGTVHINEVNDIKAVLNIPEGLAVELMSLLRRLLSPYRQVACLRWLEGGDEEYCTESLTVRELGDVVELWLERERKNGVERAFLARLPADIRIVHDEFLGQEFYTAYVNGRLLVVAGGIDEFINALRNRGFIIERLDREVQLGIEALAERVRGYLRPALPRRVLWTPTGSLTWRITGLTAS
ncbi:hypothetical protein [Vulcanisaeta sp. JCM 16161]|uniref:hypothetical protein n=1 Tax=Vulcanisaeta sp. JCM 16161 TaxID=1295372 RepID=UPI0006D1B0E4|nr:hypothetical protein [Vulcanisaeta sp. JCM 16161]